MYKKIKFPLNGVVRHNTLQILFILFSLFTFHLSLEAKEALAPLVKEGEPWHKDKFYIDKPSSVNAVAISPDGKSIVSGSYGSIKIWDMRKGELLRSLEGHKSDVRSVAISPNGKRIVSCSNGSIRIWDMRKGELQRH